MAAMKVTTSAAMRARDVSRPHAEHLAYAEAAEADAVGGRTAAPAAAAPVVADPAAAADAVAEPAGPSAAAAPPAASAPAASAPAAGSGSTSGGRRRWRPRGSGRGRAPR